MSGCAHHRLYRVHSQTGLCSDIYCDCVNAKHFTGIGVHLRICTVHVYMCALAGSSCTRCVCMYLAVSTAGVGSGSLLRCLIALPDNGSACMAVRSLYVAC